jgi:hypothetical protein
VQHVKPWTSDENIESGSRWAEKIDEGLTESDYGIVCITADNQHSPWLMFEAGALAKGVTTSRVVPLCIDLLPTDVTGPLTSFQGRKLDKDGIRKLVQELSRVRDTPLELDQIDNCFEALWPRLDQQISQAKLNVPTLAVPPRRVEDMLEEIVERIRRIEYAYNFRRDSNQNPGKPGNFQGVQEFLSGFVEFMNGPLGKSFREVYEAGMLAERMGAEGTTNLG